MKASKGEWINLLEAKTETKPAFIIQLDNPNSQSYNDIQVCLNITNDSKFDYFWTNILDTNCSNVKFVDPNTGKELPYWIEEIDTANRKAKIWIKHPKILSGNNNYVYLYFFKDKVNSPDGNAVFEFFDDFDGASLDTSKWQLSGHVSTYVRNSILTIHHIGYRGWDTYIYTKNEVRLDNTITKIKFRQINTYIRVPDFRTLKGYGGWVGWSDGYEHHRVYFDGSYKEGSQYIGGSTNWEYFEFITLNNKTITKFRNETLTKTGSYHDKIFDKLKIGDGDDYGTDNDALQVDWIYVAKYFKNEIKIYDAYVKDINITAPQIQVIDTTQTLDIFKDGSCIACYTFDGNANDLSGKYNGIWHSNEQYDTGKFGKASKFIEKDYSQYIEIPVKILNELKNSEFSISVWIKPATSMTQTRSYKSGTIIQFAQCGSCGCCGNSIILLNEYPPYGLGVNVADSPCGKGIRWSMDKIIEANKWYHIVLTSEAIYLNGKKLGSWDKKLFGDRLDRVRIGNWYCTCSSSNSCHTQKYSGLIDQVRIFNRALTEEEIQILYNEKIEKTISVFVPYIKDKIIFTYPMNSDDINRLSPYKNLVLSDSNGQSYNIVSQIIENNEKISKWSINEIDSNFEPINAFCIKDASLWVSDVITSDFEATECQLTLTEKLKEINILKSSDFSSNQVIDTTQTLDIFGDGSCIACYTFDGNANDLSGKYNGTWHGNEQYDTGKFGKAAKFDGSSYIIVSPSPIKNLKSDFSITFWFKTQNTSSGLHRIFSLTNRSSYADERLYSIYLDGEQLKYWFESDSDYDHITTILEKVNLNQWYFVVLSKQGNIANIKVFDTSKLLNNINVDTSDVYSRGVDELSFGTLYVNDYKRYDEFYTGLIDQVRIFSRPLTEEEIQKIYNEQVLSKKPSLSTLYKTTNTVLATTDEIKKGEEIILYNRKDGFKRGCIKNVNVITLSASEPQDTTQTLDIFGDNSCIACYPFDGNANDLSGKYNGTWHGNEQYDVGRFGKAAKFDGNSYIEIAGDIHQYFTTGKSWTISCWCRWNKFNYWSRVLDFKAYILITNESTSNNLVIEHFPDGKNYNCIKLNNFLQLGKLYHIVISYDANNDKYYLYINNKSMNFSISRSSTSPNSPINAFGKSSWYQDALFEGLIDQVRIFSRPLTEEEIQILYNEKIKSEGSSEGKYNIYLGDISNFGLTLPPLKAYKAPTRAYLLLETSSDRCIYENIVLDSNTILNSTSYSFQFVDTKKDLLRIGDKLIVNGKEVYIKDLKYDNSTFTFTIYVPDIGEKIRNVIIPDRFNFLKEIEHISFNPYYKGCLDIRYKPLKKKGKYAMIRLEGAKNNEIKEINLEFRNKEKYKLPVYKKIDLHK